MTAPFYEAVDGKIKVYGTDIYSIQIGEETGRFNLGRQALFGIASPEHKEWAFEGFLTASGGALAGTLRKNNIKFEDFYNSLVQLRNKVSIEETRDQISLEEAFI